MRLLRVELTRYLHRRAVLLLLAACLALPVVIGIIAVVDSRPPSPDAIAQAEAQVADDLASPDVQRSLEECVAKPDEWGWPEVDSGSAEAREVCEQAVLPTIENYLWWNELDLDQERRGGSGTAIIALLSIALLLAGTTFTGHDWASRSVSNQLLFEPRRGRVWAAKATVVTLVALLVTAAVATVYWLALAAVASSRDVLADGQTLNALQMGWRGAGVAAAASFLGFAMTTLFRSTVATIGILLGATVASSLLLASIGVVERWNPAVNLAAVVQDGVTYYDFDCEQRHSYGAEEPGVYVDTYDEGCEVEVSFTDGSLYLGSLVLVVAGASLVSFRRRDVP